MQQPPPRAGETIVAPATAPIASGVAIVRLSGPEAHAIAARLGGLTHLPHGQLQLVRLVDPADGAVLDRGFVVGWHAPRTLTGEDIAELQVHGSPAGLQRLQSACVRLGARPARAGEFTWRAFLAGKLDLAQVEALADLLHAEAEGQHKAALDQLDGVLSRHIDGLRRPLLAVLAQVEARLDFAAEPHLATLDSAPLCAQLTALQQHMLSLSATATAGHVRLHGARVVLYGAPNAGKSTLLNALVGSDRALVDHRPGTTRDTLEVRTAPQGLLVTWIDAAGIRQTEDAVERMGTERALAAVATADVVLWCRDGSAPVPHQLPAPPRLPQATLLRVLTKADLPQHADHVAAGAEPAAGWRDAVTLSAHRAADVDALRQQVVDAVAVLARGPVAATAVITRQRHADALASAAEAVGRAIATLQAGDPLELTAADLRDAAAALDELTGGLRSDDVLGEIFSAFCIGK